MKFHAALFLALPALASAFAPATRPAFMTQLAGGPASSAAEDLELTRQVVMNHLAAQSGGVVEEEEAAEAPPAPEPVVPTEE
jgi:hypothetical protein|mmetsp:Transcript_21992/g.39663  ORF Transcript_21992/g.39663 Transcript_21992/m.39663 type:complete len:82 (+) Transcript_21992:106-351(+)|eukprot:CAMPEP_0198294896 /NCGR_PEP_ID=MMETSP1449-20131203/24706_1 /TAXON_ID=420275 /ORGANISM="Attheya septentrionalis, Strain CCMP2084" /LENGTH=81 /DNA_ID=CAMNT_0043994993 /DNA_START=91 /DNA_END=336 /DNA_ORIENTATION=-